MIMGYFSYLSEFVFFLLILPQSWTHNISKEKEFLRKLVKANVITDLTNGIWVYTHPQSPSAFPQGLLNRKRGKGSTLGERTFRFRVACTLPGLSYQRRLFEEKKDTGEFLWRVAHMCLLNQRLLLTEAGREVGGGHRQDRICPLPVLSRDGRSKALPVLCFNVYNFIYPSPPPLPGITWMVRAEVTYRYQNLVWLAG